MPEQSSTKTQILGFAKLFAVVLSLLIAFGGILYAVEDRYVTQKEAATSLQSFDQAVKKDLVNLELQILSNGLESATNQYYKNKQLVREYPDDIDLKDDLDRIKSRMDSIQDKIDIKLEIH